MLNVYKIYKSRVEKKKQNKIDNSYNNNSKKYQ